LDALGLAHLPSAAGSDGVMYGNLQSVCENYASVNKSSVMTDQGKAWQAMTKTIR
jgi:hypothetical protein